MGRSEDGTGSQSRLQQWGRKVTQGTWTGEIFITKCEVQVVVMGRDMGRTEEELREETRRRRARQELRNTPLPLPSSSSSMTKAKSVSSLYPMDSGLSQGNRRNLNSLSSQRTLTSINHSRCTG